MPPTIYSKGGAGSKKRKQTRAEMDEYFALRKSKEKPEKKPKAPAPKKEAKKGSIQSEIYKSYKRKKKRRGLAEDMYKSKSK